MFLPLALPLTLHLLTAVAEKIPILDVTPSCKAAAAANALNPRDMRSCLDGEEEARKQLIREWSQFTPAEHTRCEQTVRLGGVPTYTEFVTCLEIYRDARNLPEEKGKRIGPADISR
jgi:hypothetical protein